MGSITNGKGQTFDQLFGHNGSTGWTTAHGRGRTSQGGGGIYRTNMATGETEELVPARSGASVGAFRSDWEKANKWRSAVKDDASGGVVVGETRESRLLKQKIANKKLQEELSVAGETLALQQTQAALNQMATGMSGIRTLGGGTYGSGYGLNSGLAPRSNVGSWTRSGLGASSAYGARLPDGGINLGTVKVTSYGSDANRTPQQTADVIGKLANKSEYVFPMGVGKYRFNTQAAEGGGDTNVGGDKVTQEDQEDQKAQSDGQNPQKPRAQQRKQQAQQGDGTVTKKASVQIQGPRMNAASMVRLKQEQDSKDRSAAYRQRQAEAHQRYLDALDGFKKRADDRKAAAEKQRQGWKEGKFEGMTRIDKDMWEALGKRDGGVSSSYMKDKDGNLVQDGTNSDGSPKFKQVYRENGGAKFSAENHADDIKELNNWWMNEGGFNEYAGKLPKGVFNKKGELDLSKIKTEEQFKAVQSMMNLQRGQMNERRNKAYKNLEEARIARGEVGDRNLQRVLREGVDPSKYSKVEIAEMGNLYRMRDAIRAVKDFEAPDGTRSYQTEDGESTMDKMIETARAAGLKASEIADDRGQVQPERIRAAIARRTQEARKRLGRPAPKLAPEPVATAPESKPDAPESKPDAPELGSAERDALQIGDDDIGYRVTDERQETVPDAPEKVALGSQYLRDVDYGQVFDRRTPAEPRWRGAASKYERDTDYDYDRTYRDRPSISAPMESPEDARRQEFLGKHGRFAEEEYARSQAERRATRNADTKKGKVKARSRKRRND